MARTYGEFESSANSMDPARTQRRHRRRPAGSEDCRPPRSRRPSLRPARHTRRPRQPVAVPRAWRSSRVTEQPGTRRRACGAEAAGASSTASASSPGRTSSSAAAGVASAGGIALRTLRPIPTATHAGVSPRQRASHRIPPTFRSPSIRSLGHLRPQRRSGAERSRARSAAASPTRRLSTSAPRRGPQQDAEPQTAPGRMPAPALGSRAPRAAPRRRPPFPPPRPPPRAGAARPWSKCHGAEPVDRRHHLSGPTGAGGRRTRSGTRRTTVKLWLET